MNELEARRRLLTDPRHIPAALQALVDADPRLAAHREELLATDREIHRHVTRVEVPAGLAERVVLRARFRDRSRLGLALAASVVAIAIAVPTYFATREPALGRAMFEHVAEGVDELRDNGGIEPAVLRSSVAALGVNVRDAGYRIRHLANCVIAGREGRHFTVDGPGGVITFVVLPGNSGDEPMLIREHGMEALFMQRAGLTIGVFAQAGTGRAGLERIMAEVIG